jgi:hypothetical protein
VNVRVGRGGESGLHQVATERPRGVQQRDNEPNVGERASSLIRGVLIITHAEKDLLGIQHALPGMRTLA